MKKETIAAISTPPGVGAVSIVRMSGQAAKEVLKKVWLNNHAPVDNFATHRLYYGKIVDSVNKPVDNVLAVIMKAPHSYTGEDLVEVHCHGGGLPAKEVLSALLSAGAVLAEPGEFTRRAFLNGKMDLAQAEGVAEVIASVSERAFRLAKEQLAGRLSKEVMSLQCSLKEIKALIEATIDFPEEDIELIKHDGILKKISPIKKRLNELISTYDEGRLLHDGVKVAIVGKPNVGKSSIMNLLAGHERSIVHHVPGTTRDTIEEGVDIGGVHFRLIDTAGIHHSTHEVELIGIRRTKMKLDEADLALVVLDMSRPLDKDDERIFEETKGMKSLVIFNKSDLAKKSHLKKNADTIMTSAVKGTGIDLLKKGLLNFVTPKKEKEGEGVILTNLRHKKNLDTACENLEKASSSIKNKEPVEFSALYIQKTMSELGKITGTVTTEDVLNEIFSKFCIGK